MSSVSWWIKIWLGNKLWWYFLRWVLDKPYIWHSTAACINNKLSCLFCCVAGQCIITYWRTGLQWLGPVTCPKCRQMVCATYKCSTFFGRWPKKCRLHLKVWHVNYISLNQNKRTNCCDSSTVQSSWFALADIWNKENVRIFFYTDWFVRTESDFQNY